MKTKKLIPILIILISFCAQAAFAQTANLNRKLLFTLNEHEIIYANEYFVSQQLNQKRFACIIKDTLKETYTFVFNGKRIATSNYLDGNTSAVYYLNVNEDNGYVFKYADKDLHYINIKGELYGGYEDIYDISSDSLSNWSFCYKKQGNYFVNYKGEDKGPFEYAAIFIITTIMKTPVNDFDFLYKLAGRCYAHKDGKNKLIPFIERYYNNGKYCVNINGTTSNGYDDVWSLRLSESGKYAYYYKENGKKYVNINGTSSNGYDDVDDLNVSENGKYAYSYRENWKWHVNINGKYSRGYDNVRYLYLSESGSKYAYIYMENGKKYVNINGTSSNEYDDVGALRLTESGKYAYCYKENKKEYVNINGTPSKGHDMVEIWSLRLSESGNYAYIYNEN
jgi:hypothetical protein